MKSIYFGLVLLIWVNSVFAQTTPIPDSNFENFLIAQGIDSNGANGNILNSDAAAVTTLNVTVNSITNFSGLQAFVNLVSLNLGSNQFTNVPLSALVDLEEFRFSGNDILDNLDVSNNTKLRVFIARGSGMGSDATILSIDLSNNVLLEDIQVYAFRDLDVVTLPVTNTVGNLYLLIFNTFTVDLSGYQNMHTLFLSTNFNNTFPINANLPDFPNVLRSITVQGGNLGLVDISQQMVLERFNLQSTNVQNINLPVTNTLREISITGHRISNINFQNASMLERLTITGKDTPGALIINVAQNPNLNHLTANSNYMTNVNVTQNPLLETLNIHSNELPSLNVTQNPLLETLNARNNLLPGIDVTQNPALKNLNLAANQIPNLNVTQNSLLEELTISQNLFSGTGLDLTNNTNLEYLDASENEIESLDISHTVVEDLILHHNSFAGKDILEQYFDIWNANGGLRYSNTLDVSFNLLTGRIPDFASLIVPNVTRSFSFKIDNNNFHFGDFEEEHSAYVNALTTVVNTYYTVFGTYTYAPQRKVNNVVSINRTVGSLVTILASVRGSQNHYIWYKDGVEIPNAPDSPSFEFYASPCDGGVYHCVVTSDLVPFENGNGPGYRGKNLEILRNDFALNVTGTATKQCVDLTDPLNNSTNVPVDSNISWEVAPGACGYKISLGTNAAANNVMANEDVGNTLSYDPTTNLSGNTTYFVRIVPYYTDGDQTGCVIQSFSTGAGGSVPDCTTITSPGNGATDVDLDATITWTAVSDADGYYVTIGTTSGGNDLVNALSVIGTSYTHSADFAENTTYYVSVVPYNAVGEATG
ncbi:Ig-like domain-containing protein, partial [Algoriphagus zhangzhouensis]